MSRLVWFAAGTATGVYGFIRARRTVSNFTPDGIAARAAAVGAGLRVLTSEVGVGMAEREVQLRDRLAISAGRAPDVPAIEHRPAPDGGRDGHR
jgi:hypothetical protein